ncbi:MAG TPA: hypothetical protein PLE61_10670 [Vicinamibacterales bacterium]|nr:hypothetical protein [Vicinamibacterales bacterium]HPW21260.1 hypothetical protein [Vicinamibacterales bacterium]
MTSGAQRAVVLAVTAAGLACALAACGPKPASRDGDAHALAELARLQRDNALLARQVELAAGKDFYLLLDPSAARLTLMLKGAILQHFAVRAMHVGHPRVAWVGSRDPRHVQSTVWSAGELDPPRLIDRLVIDAAPPGAASEEEAAPAIPPTPEELYPVPSRYHIRFAEGLSVEVRPREGDAAVGWWPRLRAAVSEKARDVSSAVRGAERDAIRLRLVLDPKDAQSLYRSLPPSVRLLVLDGRGAP